MLLRRPAQALTPQPWEKAWPIEEGMRVPASRIISKIIIRANNFYYAWKRNALSCCVNAHQKRSRDHLLMESDQAKVDRGETGRDQ